jgi:hypothetical protein
VAAVVSGPNGFPSSSVTPRCVTTAEAGRMLGISYTLAKAMVADGSLPSLKLGARRVVPLGVIEELIAAKVDEARRLSGRG